MDLNQKSLACRAILTRYQAGELTEPDAQSQLIALGTDPQDAAELLAIALGTDDVIDEP